MVGLRISGALLYIVILQQVSHLGVLVAIRDTIDHKIHNTLRDNEGRFIVVDLTIQGGKDFTIVNIHVDRRAHKDHTIHVFQEN